MDCARFLLKAGKEKTRMRMKIIIYLVNDEEKTYINKVHVDDPMLHTTNNKQQLIGCQGTKTLQCLCTGVALTPFKRSTCGDRTGTLHAK